MWHQITSEWIGSGKEYEGRRAGRRRKYEEIRVVNKGKGEVRAEDNEQDIKPLKRENISVPMCL
jgi:hypothetical protein